DCETILNRLNHEIRHVQGQDLEAETRQVALSYAILPGIGLVCEFRWPNHGPVKTSSIEGSLHGSRVRHNARKQKPTEQVRRRNDGVLEQEGNRFDDNSSHFRVFHRGRQRCSKLLQKVSVRFRNRQARAERGYHSIVALNSLDKLRAIETYTFLDCDPLLNRA